MKLWDWEGAGVAAVLMLALVGGVHAETIKDGFAAAKRGDYATAYRLWRPLAEQGAAAAQYNLGLMYETGLGVPQDYTEAMRWDRKAAKQGLAVAQYSLAVMYYTGLGVPQDYTEAIRWYRKAAKQGDAMAQHSLGVMYYTGLGVPQDHVEAHKWFNLATAAGDAGAAKYRDLTSKLMTAAQIAEAQRLAREWRPKKQN
jgi:hypothetical protein